MTCSCPVPRSKTPTDSAYVALRRHGTMLVWSRSDRVLRLPSRVPAVARVPGRQAAAVPRAPRGRPVARPATGARSRTPCCAVRRRRVAAPVPGGTRRRRGRDNRGRGALHLPARLATALLGG